MTRFLVRTRFLRIGWSKQQIVICNIRIAISRKLQYLQIAGKSYNYHGFSPQSVNVTGFPTTGKTCRHPVMPCKHLQCTAICKMRVRRVWSATLDCRQIISASFVTFYLSCLQTHNLSPNARMTLECDFSSLEMVFCYQNCSDLLWEKIVWVIEKNFWNLKLKAENFQKFWDQ